MIRRWNKRTVNPQEFTRLDCVPHEFFGDNKHRAHNISASLTSMQDSRGLQCDGRLQLYIFQFLRYQTPLFKFFGLRCTAMSKSVLIFYTISYNICIFWRFVVLLLQCSLLPWSKFDWSQNVAWFIWANHNSLLRIATMSLSKTIDYV